MDTITHGIAGALIGKGFFAASNAGTEEARQRARLAIFAVTSGAVFPDIDVLAGLILRNDLATIEWHRGLTHSLVCLPVWAMALAAVTHWYARRRGWPAISRTALAGNYAVGLVSHILLDLVTSFGTMIWSPLNWSRPAWDIVFILDFTLTAIALLPQVLAWVYREPAQAASRAGRMWGLFACATGAIWWLLGWAGLSFSSRYVGAICAVLAALFFLPAWGGWGLRVRQASWCRAGVYAMTAYLGLCGWTHAVALHRVELLAASRGLRPERLGALPLPPGPTHWDAIIQTPAGVYETRLNLLENGPPESPNSLSPSFQFFAEAAPSPYIAAARELPSVQAYLGFARFPVFSLEERSGAKVVTIRDLRFFQRGRGPAPFTFQVILDAQGRVLHQGWINR